MDVKLFSECQDDAIDVWRARFTKFITAMDAITYEWTAISLDKALDLLNDSELEELKRVCGEDWELFAEDAYDLRRNYQANLCDRLYQEALSNA